MQKVKKVGSSLMILFLTMSFNFSPAQSSLNVIAPINHSVVTESLRMQAECGDCDQINVTIYYDDYQSHKDIYNFYSSEIDTTVILLSLIHI